MNPTCEVNIFSSIIFDQRIPLEEYGGGDNPYVNSRDTIMYEEFKNVVNLWCNCNIPKNVFYKGGGFKHSYSALGKSHLALCFSRSEGQKHDDTKLMNYLRSGCQVICDNGQPSHRFIKETNHGFILPFNFHNEDLQIAYQKCIENINLKKRQEVATQFKKDFGWKTVTEKILKLCYE